jgi:hypothetical protein
LAIGDVMRLTGLPNWRIRQLERYGKFPRRLDGMGRALWFADEMCEWVHDVLPALQIGSGPWSRPFVNAGGPRGD